MGGEGEVVRQLLSPRSVVVIGASDQPGKLGTNLVQNLKKFQGDVYYVNPRRARINGVQAYDCVEAIEGQIDLALVLIPVAQVPVAIEQCARAGVRTAIILSAGFHELGTQGGELKDRITKTAKASGMRLLGPNCTGVLNTASRLNACMVMLPEVHQGELGLFGQSGALLGGLLWDYCELDGLGLGQVVTLGDKIDISELDVLAYFMGECDIAVAAGYVETFNDSRDWLALCNEFTKSKPLILLRGGRTEIGRQASWSHTGRLASPSKVFDTALDDAGVTQVDDFSTLLGYAAGFDYLRRFPGPKRRIAVATTSGAVGVVLADQIARANLEMASLETVTIDEIVTKGLAGVGFSPTEQIDLELPGERVGLTRAVCDCIEILSNDSEVDVIVLALAALGHFADFDPQAVANVCRRSAKPVFVWPYGRNDLKTAWKRALGQVTRVSADVEALASCIGAYENWRARCHSISSSNVELTAPVLPSDTTLLDESDLRQRLATCSLPFVEAKVVVDQSDLGKAALAVGYPVVLKHLLPGQTHKTEHQSVLLDVKNESELLLGASRMKGGGRWLIQRMITQATEAFVGVNRDPLLGPIVSVGMGGVLVELLGDVKSKPAVLDVPQAEALILSTRLGRLLEGYREIAPRDLGALAAMLVRVGQIACETPELVELEFNPVMVLEKGVLIVDARAQFQ